MEKSHANHITIANIYWLNHMLSHSIWQPIGFLFCCVWSRFLPSHFIFNGWIFCNSYWFRWCLCCCWMVRSYSQSTTCWKCVWLAYMSLNLFFMLFLWIFFLCVSLPKVHWLFFEMTTKKHICVAIHMLNRKLARSFFVSLSKTYRAFHRNIGRFFPWKIWFADQSHCYNMIGAIQTDGCLNIHIYSTVMYRLLFVMFVVDAKVNIYF